MLVCCYPSSSKHGHSLAVAEELVLLLTGLDGRAAELGDEDAVTDGDAHG